MAIIIPEDKVADVKNAADIVDIVSESVILKKAGKNYVGLCPFHSEKTPSFSVNADKQIYHCFGCGVGGDVISFIMESDGISFTETVRKLAAKYGIEIPDRQTSASGKREYSEREKLFTINKLARDYFHSQLIDNNTGKNALGYLERRGITRQIVDNFSLGYAPPGWEGLKRFLSGKRVPESLIEKAGLIISNQRGGFYDRFRNRVIFPICDAGARVTGFGGRVMDDSMPKYLNSPETPVYSKSRSLYGLHMTKQRCRQEGMAYIVEGYMDLLALCRHGINNVVATLGTALTQEHVLILKGHSRKVTLVYDSDEAGIKAAARCVHILNNDVEPRILVLSQGFDPDSYLSEFGPEAFKKEAGSAMGLMDFLTDFAVKNYGLSVDGIMNVISEMKIHLARIDDKVKRSLYIKKLSETIGVDEAAILEKVREECGRKSGGMKVNVPEKQKWSRMEESILVMMLQFPDPDIMGEIKKRKVLYRFKSETLKAIGQKVIDNTNTDASKPFDLRMITQDREEQRLIVSLSVKEYRWDYEGCRSLLNQFMSSSSIRDDRLLDIEIQVAEEKNDQETLIKLLEEKQRLVKEKYTALKGGYS
ncbi:MAG: DNA primase [Deltaproteobacteria bacterium]|nr:DNA primase [Deltaproteobacteria bacterium]